MLERRGFEPLVPLLRGRSCSTGLSTLQVVHRTKKNRLRHEGSRRLGPFFRRGLRLRQRTHPSAVKATRPPTRWCRTSRQFRGLVRSGAGSAFVTSRANGSTLDETILDVLENSLVRQCGFIQIAAQHAGPRRSSTASTPRGRRPPARSNLRALPLPLEFLVLHPVVFEDPLAWERLFEPVEKLRGRVDLVVVSSFRKDCNFVQIFGQPRGLLQYIDEAVLDEPGLRVHSHNFVAVGLVAGRPARDVAPISLLNGVRLRASRESKSSPLSSPL